MMLHDELIAPVELTVGDFTEQLEPIFRSVEARLPEEMRGRKSEYFFPQWKKFMKMGFARTWFIPGAVLGLLITPDIFSGRPTAQVPFWFSIPGTKGTVSLIHAAEKAAREAGCNRISIAAFSLLQGDRVAKIYEWQGYSELERTFSKAL